MSAGLLDVEALAVLTRQLEPIAAAVTTETEQPVEERQR